MPNCVDDRLHRTGCRRHTGVRWDHVVQRYAWRLPKFQFLGVLVLKFSGHRSHPQQVHPCADWRVLSCFWPTPDALLSSWYNGQKKPEPVLPQLRRSRPKFPKRCRPLDCACVPHLVQIGCDLPELFVKGCFWIHNVGWKPAMWLSAYNNNY